VTGRHPTKKDQEEKRKPDPKEPFCGLVFKIVADKHGDLYYLRLYSGTLKANSRVWNPTRQVKEFASKLYHIHADPSHREDVPVATAGDIVAIIGPKDSITGDTLCEQQQPIVLEQIHFAEAVVSQSIEPESSADKDKLVDALNRLKREDPTFTWRVSPDTGETQMSGMGILHLEVKRHRLERDFRLKVKVRKPLVSYRETIKRALRVEGECVRQTGTSGLFAKLTVDFAPRAAGSGNTVSNEVDTELLAPELAYAAEQGITGALQSGELGYPVIDVQATIRAAQLQEELSNDIAFQAAGADAVHKALRDNMVLLEPVMRTEVTVPEEYLGPVNADLNARRAEIREVLSRGKLRVIEALVPLAKMFDYSDKVRSLTQGRASWTMEPAAYAPVPEETRRQMFGSDDFI
jgi:elongation factor G